MEQKTDMKFVLIDTDGGGDDCLALFIALAAHKDPKVALKIVGITCVNGNTTLENVCLNVTRTLQTANVNDIPVFAGCDSPMVVPFERNQVLYHGKNGFCDVELPPLEPKIEEENGVLALLRLAKEYKDKGQLSLVALGPLTNLAMAVRLDPTIADCIKEIYIMGGNSRGVGNIRMCAEFNFFVDPESAFVTLHTFPCPIVIVPWELCKDKRKTFSDFRLNEIGKLASPAMQLLNKIEAKHLSQPNCFWSPTDGLCMAVFLQPSLIDEFQDAYCTVELTGTVSRGLLAIDHDNRLGNPKNARIVISTHDEQVKQLLYWAVGGQTENPLINL